MEHAVAPSAGRVAAATHSTRVENFSAERSEHQDTAQGEIGFEEDDSHLLGMPSQPRHEKLLPPHTPHASRIRLELTVNVTILLRMVLIPPAVSEM